MGRIQIDDIIERVKQRLQRNDDDEHGFQDTDHHTLRYQSLCGG
jgi:hypothetical protein